MNETPKGLWIMLWIGVAVGLIATIACIIVIGKGKRK